MRTKTGADGKLYPAQMPPPRAWRWQVLRLTHQLAHEDGLSEHATRLALAGRGYRRSAGSVHYDLTRQMPGCPVCDPEAVLDCRVPGYDSEPDKAESAQAAPAGRA